MTEPLLTAVEAAAILHTRVPTMYQLAASGRLDSIRTPGGRRLFREADVRALPNPDPTQPTT